MNTTINSFREGRVAIVELSRPEAMNAIDTVLRRELLTALDEVARTPDVGAVILCAQGKAFCSGADLKAASANPDTSVRRTARTLLHDFQPILETITRLDKPVIAAVNGAAVGVGMSLVLACDLVVMDQNAFLMSPFVNIGLMPDGGAAWFLTRRLGYARAFELMAEGEKLRADRCLELGLANRVVASENLRENCLQWASKLAAQAPLALALTKRLARLSMSASLSDSLTLEAEFQTFLASTSDAREAIAAFGEKRNPNFKGS